MKFLITGFGQKLFEEGLAPLLSMAFRARETARVFSVDSLEQAIKEMEPGDIFIGMLGDLRKDFIITEEDAAQFVETINGWLPMGARALLVDTISLGNSVRVREVLESSLDRIALVDAFNSQELMNILRRWTSES